jgi:hypothetical protein
VEDADEKRNVKQYTRPLKTMKYILLLIILTAAIAVALSTPGDPEPGVDRWSIKTSVDLNQTPKKVTLKKLLKLGNPIEHDSQSFDENRITTAVGGLKEGDLITTKGWMKLVAFEHSGPDGDYHIQLRTDSTWGDTCFIIEIPYEDFIENDAALKDSCRNAREFVRERILENVNKEPSTKGNVIGKAYVRVTGALFFDSHHINANPLRGKKGKMTEPMKSYTCWELHPVTHIEFAKRP